MSEEFVEVEDPIVREEPDSKLLRLCLKQGHKYTAVEDSNHMQIVGKDTYNRRSFICTACGDVINPVISVWKDFIPKRRNSS